MTDTTLLVCFRPHRTSRSAWTSWSFRIRHW